MAKPNDSRDKHKLDPVLMYGEDLVRRLYMGENHREAQLQGDWGPGWDAPFHYIEGSQTYMMERNQKNK